ncbi:histidine kinase [Chryseobacterium gallinarum]|uniref:Histidine kinase n=2 Tax=Chryseobacterium gallinarum TaxID=1324352 RepID=A0A0G3M9Z9_CHRGL|nr:histidine kinase [Chryseobacterium gallinarum]
MNCKTYTMKLALIDDNARLRDITKKQLEDSGYTLFFQSENEQEAIQKIEESNTLPDVCIIEENFGAANALLGKFPDLKVLISSTNDDKKSVTDMLEIGVWGYILKYADPDELLTAVEALSKGKKYFSLGVSDIATEYYRNN